MAEDPPTSVNLDQATGAAVVAGMSEQELELIVDRLKGEFGVEATVGSPHVAYKETLTRAAEGQGRYIRQSAGRGQYAHARLHIYPGERGSGCVFESRIVAGAIPQEFIQPVEEGIKHALRCGVLAGYPVDDVRVELYDGSYHEVDSSEATFRIAGALALQDAAKNARPVVLEPVMRVAVTTPQDCSHDVIGDLLSRRAQIQSREERDGSARIHARAPLSEMFGYAADLRVRTHGRGAFTMEFASYEPVDVAEDERGDWSPVNTPRRPFPKLRDSSTAVPEPTQDD